MKLSIVTTLYQSAPYITEFHRRISQAASSIVGDDYEIIYVNDGSPDQSLEAVLDLLNTDKNISVIDLSRNFGHHKAMMTGLAHVEGDLVFLIDSDLEEEPELLSTFFSEYQNQQDLVDVFFGVQIKRRGAFLEKWSGWFFYKMFRLLTGVNQVDNISTVRLMSKRYVKALVEHSEREINIGGLWITTGFKQQAIPFEKKTSSPTSYSFSRKLSHFVNAVTSFSSFPLVFTFYMGLMISFSSGSFIAYLIGNYFLTNSIPDGYTSLIVSICFFSGLIIFFIGVQGIYIAKIFTEVKQRPYTVIRDIYHSKKED